MTKKFYRLNQYISAPKVRVIDEKGKQLGVLTINEALELARSKKADLIEVAEHADPPVCKIIDFKKFRYLEAKKLQGEKKKNKRVEIKEVRLSPFIAENDFRFRIKRAQEFLADGDKVRMTVFFKGRQMGKRSFGLELINKAKASLSPYSQAEGEPKFSGRVLEITLSPIKGGKNESKNENKKVSAKEA